ncbi:dihydrolipoamide dehydrogenase [Winogradskyella litoriviva]|uniref:Dihydrolipoamide dehydrogenase n=1 Tax=Winogradskyella litoriviva TaxID=1220182 RepID=A0ABX2E5U5_9FLAO|nr:dihydrolipoamide dehydrogenase [Winogradskyella litoriviva]NRD23772.1 dihydrolipoamide dehydrogenase [Winogradskyella litoriviva]
MKRILSIITLFVLLISCTGEQGPPGFDGYDGIDGQDGVNFVGQSFERTIDFTAPNYQEDIEIPLDIDLLESDMVLVYHLKDVVDGYDVWKSLPETVYISAGEEFQYNFEHNFDFVSIFIESHPNFDFDLLFDEERINQTFRIVILPVDFVNSSNLDVNNFEDIMQYVQ